MSIEQRIAKVREELRQDARTRLTRRSRPKTKEHSPEFLAAREDFRVRWEAIHKEGEDKGYLVWEGSYEGEWVVDSRTTRETREVEYLETAAEFTKRVNDDAEWRLEERIRNGRL